MELGVADRELPEMENEGALQMSTAVAVCSHAPFSSGLAKGKFKSYFPIKGKIGFQAWFSKNLRH